MAQSHSNGTIVKKGSSSIGLIRKVSGPEATTSKVDTSHLNITDWVKTSVPGLIDPGDMSVDVFYDASDRATLLTDQYARTVSTYGAFFPTSGSFTGPGFVQKVGLEMDLDGIIMVPVTIACTGKWSQA